MRQRNAGLVVLSIAFVLLSLLATHVGYERESKRSGQKAEYVPQTRNFQLYVRENTLTMPDGQKLWVFGYSDTPSGNAQVPGPPLVVNQDDTVNITLNNIHDPTITGDNATGEGHTIHLHGLDLPSQFDGDPMTAPGKHGVLQGSSYTYRFVAHEAGTYWYHCHVMGASHIQMGMYGALIIRPRGQANRAYATTPVFDKEYTFVLSDMDSHAHDAVYRSIYAGSPAFNWTSYSPNYFLINGKAWPDTMKDPADHIEASLGQTVLVRLINAGYVVHSMHSHGYHFTVIGSDGRALPQPYQKDTLDIAPGETYEILFHFNQSGSFMFHDHIEQYTTNNGIYPGGMLTMITVK